MIWIMAYFSIGLVFAIVFSGNVYEASMRPRVVAAVFFESWVFWPAMLIYYAMGTNF